MLIIMSFKKNKLCLLMKTGNSMITNADTWCPPGSMYISASKHHEFDSSAKIGLIQCSCAIWPLGHADNLTHIWVEGIYTEIFLRIHKCVQNRGGGVILLSIFLIFWRNWNFIFTNSPNPLLWYLIIDCSFTY